MPRPVLPVQDDCSVRAAYENSTYAEEVCYTWEISIESWGKPRNRGTEEQSTAVSGRVKLTHLRRPQARLSGVVMLLDSAGDNPMITLS
jgi:hypothetical protein